MVADDLYTEIMDRRLAHIQVSITSTDDRLARRLERAPAPSLRIKAVEKLSRLGFDVSVRLSPLIPEYIDFERLAGVECDKVLVEFLRVNGHIAAKFPLLDTSPYTLFQSGYRHLPLEYKIGLVERIRGFSQISVCEDVSEHYNY